KWTMTLEDGGRLHFWLVRWGKIGRGISAGLAAAVPRSDPAKYTWSGIGVAARPSDHAGVVAQLPIPVKSTDDYAPLHRPWPRSRRLDAHRCDRCRPLWCLFTVDGEQAKNGLAVCAEQCGVEWDTLAAAAGVAAKSSDARRRNETW